jgi:phosphocarrier protein HPr
MVQRIVTVRNKIGIHSRPAALLVDMASRFKSQITIRNGERSAQTTSMVKLLALRVKQDNEITIIAEGEDAADAVKALSDLIESKFGEE